MGSGCGAEHSTQPWCHESAVGASDGICLITWRNASHVFRRSPKVLAEKMDCNQALPDSQGLCHVSLMHGVMHLQTITFCT